MSCRNWRYYIVRPRRIWRRSAKILPAADWRNRLNQLLGRAHNRIYMGRRAKAGGIVTFYRDTFPQVFHETLPYTLAACGVFFAMAAAGLMMAIVDPGFQRYFLGPAMMESIDKHQMWTHSVVSIKPLASSEIMTNNLSVSFATFALGHHRRHRHACGCWRSTDCSSAWSTPPAGRREWPGSC